MPRISSADDLSTQLKTSLQNLKGYSATMNKVTDEANETIRMVEQFLNEECSIGIPCGVLLKDLVEDDGTPYRADWLEYRRINGKFRIAIATYWPDGDEGERAWSDCPREEKLESYKKLPDLLIELTKKVLATVTETRENTQMVSQVVKGLIPKKE
jgi:hypothetical protein